MRKSTSLFDSLLAAISMMSAGVGSTFAPFGAASASASRPTGKRRSRWPGEPGVPGSKLARKAAERRLTGDQHPR